ncbi:YbaB/EbfC family nucleoid-associated protein [Auraticoccus monumenti]|uniref:YbaB/EbfC DNA-binding family protein n=1 Tax=Auraticoccus monumenti TaxID=675864 RepID=A0A1G6SDB5_9ACTN|nr:YbaB/EbfC family nucleoid-associated protein [Auraticoccus monumenti]SDD14661.1 YbaB/EbfC DNA-binding family protein [Auraticoccus monumenti]
MTEPSARGRRTLDSDADLDHQVGQLRRRREELDRELDDHRRHLDATLEALRTVRGRGAAEDDAVVVVVDARNQVVDLQLEPRAMHLGSIARLRQALLTAHRRASADAAEQLREAGAREGDDTDPVTRLVDLMPEVVAHVGADLLAPPDRDTVDDEDGEPAERHRHHHEQHRTRSPFE